MVKTNSYSQKMYSVTLNSFRTSRNCLFPSESMAELAHWPPSHRKRESTAFGYKAFYHDYECGLDISPILGLRFTFPSPSKRISLTVIHLVYEKGKDLL